MSGSPVMSRIASMSRPRRRPRPLTDEELHAKAEESIAELTRMLPQLERIERQGIIRTVARYATNIEKRRMRSSGGTPPPNDAPPAEDAPDNDDDETFDL